MQAFFSNYPLDKGVIAIRLRAEKLIEKESL
jgi:hypothetical protein